MKSIYVNKISICLKKQPLYVFIICVFVDFHKCQFSHTHPNLKHSHPSEILAYYLTYTPTQSGRQKWMSPKSTIFDFEKNS